MLSIIKTFNLFMTPLYHVVDRMKKAGIMPLIMGRKRSKKKANNDWRTIVYSRLHYIELYISVTVSHSKLPLERSNTVARTTEKKPLRDDTPPPVHACSIPTHPPAHGRREASARPASVAGVLPSLRVQKKKNLCGGGGL